MGTFGSRCNKVSRDNRLDACLASSFQPVFAFLLGPRVLVVTILYFKIKLKIFDNYAIMLSFCYHLLSSEAGNGLC